MTTCKQRSSHNSTINSHRTRRQAGASLTEYLLYAALAGLVIVGATKLFGSADASTDYNGMQSDMQSIRTGTRQYGGISGNYGTAGADITANLSSAFPSNIGGSGANRTNPFNGALTVKVGATSNQFVITTASVPQGVCIKFLGSLDTSWTSVSVNGGAAITTFPVPGATAVTNCNAATNTIALTAT